MELTVNRIYIQSTNSCFKLHVQNWYSNKSSIGREEKVAQWSSTNSNKCSNWTDSPCVWIPTDWSECTRERERESESADIRTHYTDKPYVTIKRDCGQIKRYIRYMNPKCKHILSTWLNFSARKMTEHKCGRDKERLLNEASRLTLCYSRSIILVN